MLAFRRKESEAWRRRRRRRGEGGRGDLPVRGAVFVGFGEGAGVEAGGGEGAGRACGEEDGEGELGDGEAHCGLWW